MQALSYWKVARRNRAAEAKVYRLANTPCNPTSVADNLFTVDNGNLVTNDTARDRSVGLNNRIVGGMLLHTWRSIDQECPVTRFSTIQVGGLTRALSAPEQACSLVGRVLNKLWCDVIEGFFPLYSPQPTSSRQCY